MLFYESTFMTLFMIHFTAACINVSTSTRRENARKGSRERLEAATITVLSSAVCLISAAMGSVMLCYNGDFRFSIVTVSSSIFWSIILWLDLNDDDWLDERKEDLKRGLKEVRKKLPTQSAAPLPSPS